MSCANHPANGLRLPLRQVHVPRNLKRLLLRARHEKHQNPVRWDASGSEQHPKRQQRQFRSDGKRVSRGTFT